ncbi:unnamed protein product [Clavelina lepadiformis]|uniref:Uncharacterized protein n=1 Tax=Clavelina lepadiformis TaxID=159417 RepID=A0ABP0FTB6_CLALP
MEAWTPTIHDMAQGYSTGGLRVFKRPGKPMQKTVAVNCGAANPNSSMHCI